MTTQTSFSRVASSLEGFFGSRQKAARWFQTPNPLLGGAKPWSMVNDGRIAKLEAFVATQIAGNQPPKPL